MNETPKDGPNQSQFDDLLQKFIVDGLKTYSMVEEPAFRDFVHGAYCIIKFFIYFTVENFIEFLQS